MWNSFASLGSLVVPTSTQALPGLSQPQDDDQPSSAKRMKTSKPLEDYSLPPEISRAYSAEAGKSKSYLGCPYYI